MVRDGSGGLASGRGAAALALMLAACAPVADAPPLGALAVAPGALAAASRSLPLSAWEAVEPRAIILALHGFGEYGESAFGTAGPVWAGQGISTYAYDQRGFGRNPDRLDWPGETALVEDAAAAYAAVRAAHPGVPIHVLGHSMGGGVALVAAGEGRFPGADSLILLAPATWGGATLPVLFRVSIWLAGQVAPDKRWTGERVVEIRPTDNLPALEALTQDPYFFGVASSRELLGLVRLMDRALAEAGRVTLPTLMVYGARDEVIPKDPVSAAYDAIPAEKRFVAPPEGWHMLLRDLNAAAVEAAVADWVLR